MADDERRTEPDWFQTLAGALLQRPGVSRSTMMGFPCLRLDGDFFACRDVRSGDLVVKLTEARVSALLEAGEAMAFAPNGRRFKAWAAIPSADTAGCERLLAEALQCAAERRAVQSSTHSSPSSGAGS